MDYLILLMDTTINITVCILALKTGGLSDIKLQHLISTLRNRTTHKCDLTNVCNALETKTELTSLKDDDGNSRIEHYPAPYIDFQENML